MNTGVIVVKNSGEVLPQAFLEKILANNASCSGAAVVIDGQISVAQENKVNTLEALTETIEQFKGHSVILFFGQSDDDYHADDVPPFTLIKDGDDPRLVAFLEGDFTPFAETGSAHTNEFQAYAKYLVPKFKGIYDSKMGDKRVEQLMDVARLPLFKMEMNNMNATRGTTVLLASTGEILSFAKGYEEQKFPWGWASQLYGYEEKSYPEKVDNKPKLSLLAAALAKVKSAPKKEEPQFNADDEEVVVDDTPPLDTPPTGDTSNVQLLVPATEMRTPPKGMSHKKLKNWYKHNAVGRVVPENWIQGPAVSCRVMSKDLSSLQQNMKPKMEDTPKQETHSVLTELPKSTEEIEEARANKDVTPAHIQHETTTSVTTMPIISDETLTRIKDTIGEDVIKKIVDRGSKTIDDPARMQELEKKYPTFVERMGLHSIQDTFLWPLELRMQLHKEFPVAMAILQANLTADLIKMLIEKNKASDTTEQKRTTILGNASQKRLAM